MTENRHKCPFDEALQVALEEATAKPFENEEERARVIGGIVETNVILEKLQERVACSPTNSTDCPMQNLTLTARSHAATRWLMSNYAMDLGKIGKEIMEQDGQAPGSTSPTGQYL